MAHRLLVGLVAEGRLVRGGAGRSASYADSGGLPFVRRYPRAVLAEDRVWAEVAPGGLAFIINDDGVGIFANLRKVLRLPSDLVALQELSKGKLTTLPAGHTGEGVFFTSKAARLFELSSGGLRWIVDNLRSDTAIGSSPVRRGTVVLVEVARRPRRALDKVFAEYTEDLAFTKTRVVIKLFTLGTRFISRSEARRVVANLEKWRSVVLDFAGVEEIGQGFADEVFRVWARAHPATKLEPVSMAAPIAFLVNRARGK